jgi:hypothetical protein
MEGIVFALAMCKEVSARYFPLALYGACPIGWHGTGQCVGRQVHVFGFNIDTPSSVPYHYHDKVVGVTSAHSFNYQARRHVQRWKSCESYR